MKKATKPASAKKTVPKKSATKQSAAKPKAKPSAKPKRKTQGQAELLPILERLAQSAEKLAQAAERMAEAAVHQPPPRTEERDQSFKSLSESIAEATTRENE